MKRELGFTLMELMIVMAIVAISTAIVAPNMIGWRADASLRGAVGNLRGDINLAKATAVKENGWVAVLFSADSYQLFVDNGANPGNWIREPDERILRDRQLPAGISIDLAGTDFDSDRTRFNERGLPENLGMVVVVGLKGDQHEIELNRLGRISVQ
jgi:type IV fimbrial biogenesis protein FimT